MSRRSGFIGVMNAVVRDVARAQRQAQAAQRRAVRDAIMLQREADRQVREAERRHNATLRQAAAAEREAKRQYIEDQNEAALDRTQSIERMLGELETVLRDTLAINDQIDFESLRVPETFPPFAPSPELLRSLLAPNLADYVTAVPPLGRLAALFSWFRKRHEAQLLRAGEQFERDAEQHRQREQKRQANLDAAKKDYDDQRFAAVWQATQRNSEVAEFEKAYRRGDPRAIVAYNEMVLTRSVYPDGFPQQFRLAYNVDSKELVVDYQLPNVAIVPAAAEVRYVKTRDAFEEKPRKPAEIKQRYQDVIASVALRTLHEIFEADQGDHVVAATFSGYVEAVDRATGRDVRPYLISVRTTRDAFLALDLTRVDTKICLRNLGASVSAHADELVPVKPIVEFDMVDKRFVEAVNVMSELDARPNIMDLTPFQFEQLVGNLFSRMGLETRQTRSVRDGGVDVVAFDTRPILGGKVVIQAKRYRHAVGVSAVRDLFGTMMNEGANKGILVATSGYGSDAFTFVKDKPIELIDGGQLLYLCDQVGVKARIVMPTE